MNLYKNEKGFALVLTLLIITVFFLFILSQFYLVTNTTKQVTTTEKQVDAELIAEMGVDYYQNLVDKSVHEQGITDPKKVQSPRPPGLVIPRLDANHMFQISHISNPKITKLANKTEVEITFTSTGVSFDKEKAIEDDIKIIFKSE